jgi:hypothetical protein
LRALAPAYSSSLSH